VFLCFLHNPSPRWLTILRHITISRDCFNVRPDEHQISDHFINVIPWAAVYLPATNR